MKRKGVTPNAFAVTRASSTRVMAAVPRVGMWPSRAMAGAWRHCAPYRRRLPWQKAAPRAGGARHA